MFKRRIAQKPEYIYDPEHEKKPAGGYHKTEQGWSLSKSKSIDLTQKQNEHNSKDFQKIYQKQITDQDVITLYDEKGNKVTKKFGQMGQNEKKDVLRQISTCQLVHAKGFSDYSKVDKQTFQKNMDKVLQFIQDKDIPLKNNQRQTPIHKNLDRFISEQDQNLQRVIARYSSGVRSKFAVSALSNYKNKMMEVLKQACTKEGGLGNVSQKDMDAFLQDEIKRLVYQQIQTRRRSMGDHGIRHLVGNALNSVDIMQQLNKGGISISGKDKLLAMSTMVNHDIGYTLGQVAIDASKGGFHKSYSGIIALEQKDRYQKIFGKDGAEKMVGKPLTYSNGKPMLKRQVDGQWKFYTEEQAYDEKGNLKLTEEQYQNCKIEHEKGKQGVIQYHDSSNYDWKNDPIGSSVALSDCTALFGKDKVQQFFYKNDEAMQQITKLQCLLLSDVDEGVKQTSFSNFKKRMKKHINELQDATPLDKDLLQSQIDEMTIGKFSTVDDILTRSSGVLEDNPFSYDSEKNQVIVETKYSQQGNLLDNIFGSDKMRNQWSKLYKDIQGSGKIVLDENGNQSLFKGDPDKNQSRVLIKINGFTGSQFRNNGVVNVFKKIPSFPIRKQLARLSQMFSLNKDDSFIKKRVLSLSQRLTRKEQGGKSKGQIVFGDKWDKVKELLKKMRQGVNVSALFKTLGFSEQEKSYLSSMFKKASINKFAMKIAEDTYIDILANRLASEMSKRYEMKLGKIKFIFESYGQLDILFDGHLYSILNRLQMENVQKFVNLNKSKFNKLKNEEDLKMLLDKNRLKYRRKF